MASQAEDGIGQVCIGVYCVVDCGEGIKEVKGWSGKELPLRGGESVKILSAAMCGVVMGGGSVLAKDVSSREPEPREDAVLCWLVVL